MQLFVWNRAIFTFICSIFSFESIVCYRFEPNVLTIHNHTTCPGDEKNPVHVKYDITPVTGNKYVVNGEIIFTEYINGQLEVLQFFQINPFIFCCFKPVESFFFFISCKLHQNDVITIWHSVSILMYFPFAICVVLCKCKIKFGPNFMNTLSQE